MAEESDLEKTEPASPRKLEQAREEGDVPRSRELATCSILLAGGIAFWMSGESLVRRMNNMLTNGLSFEREHAFDLNLLLQHMVKGLVDVAIGLAPIAGILILVALASPLLIGGWLFSGKALMPQFGRMNPIKGIGNMFSTRSLVELVKAIGKAGLVGVISWMVISSQIDAMLGLAVEPLQTSA
ncbi:MAG TPA: EscU/YscU/HrcU family type III secretion system export apparatus switch protein, partial [Noviherbaspirillum sp.]